MKLYLDNCIVSGVVKEDLCASEIKALEVILRLFREGSLDLRTSEVTRREFERHGCPQKRKEFQEVYELLKQVPYVEDHEVVGFHSQWDHLGGVAYPLVQDDTTSSRLRQIGLDRTDAHHLMLAILARCQRFITTDRRTILKWRSQVEDRFPIRLLKPSAFVEQEGELLSGAGPALPG